MAELALKRLLRSFTPFGYRGYCYDTFTGLYYLQSRYYDPNTGRFINADDTNYLNSTGTVLGCNLFAYCENDPVNRVDPKGTLAISHKVAQLILGAVLGFVVQYIVDLIDVKIFRGSWSHWSDYVYSVVKEAWGAVSDSGFLKTIKVVAGMAVISEVLRCISKKVDFSIRNAFNKVIDAVIDFVLSSVLKIKSPKFIRDIKTKARNLGIKGTKKLTKFLNNEIFKVNLANITLSNLVSLIKEVVRKIFKNNSFKLVKY
jgi:RHS repeat-associated protein